MKPLLSIIIVVFLTGCANKTELIQQEKQIEVKTEYVIKIPPKELLQLPPKVSDIDVTRAKQGDVAKWILLNEERTRKLENMIIEMGKFFKSEEAKLNK